MYQSVLVNKGLIESVLSSQKICDAKDRDLDLTVKSKAKKVADFVIEGKYWSEIAVITPFLILSVT